MKKYIIALDQGTTSSRAVIFDAYGNVCASHAIEFPQIYPKPGWVEHNPEDIYSSQVSAMRLALEKSGIAAEEILAVGIANQRETTLVWEKDTGKPLMNAIVWQCRRTAPLVERLKKDGLGNTIRDRTGLIPDAYFSGTKLQWMLDEVEGARRRAENGELLFGTVDSWLIYNLTKGAVHVTDYTNASRTMIFDIHKLCWDEELLKLLNIPKSMLPQVKPSSCLYGYTESSVLGGEIPIAGIAGDQQAALFGQCCFGKGQVKNTYGTGCFLLMNTGYEAIASRNGLLTTIAASTGEKVEYALEGSVFVAGAAIQWLRDGMRMIKTADKTQKYAERVEDTAEVYMVPAFAGMGAPYWNPYARGTIVGITRGCEKEHFVRAALESIAYQTYDVLKAMEEDAEVSITELKVDGGASANDFLMQFQSDILGARVYRPECIETTALGAAYLAGLATGYYKNREEICENWQLGKEFDAGMGEHTREKLLKGWKKAVRCALIWAEQE